MYEWVCTDTGEIYQIMYIVTHGDEGPEFYQWRKSTPATEENINSDVNLVWTEWQALPPFVNSDDMREIEKHFHG